MLHLRGCPRPEFPNGPVLYRQARQAGHRGSQAQSQAPCKADLTLRRFCLLLQSDSQIRQRVNVILETALGRPQDAQIRRAAYLFCGPSVGFNPVPALLSSRRRKSPQNNGPLHRTSKAPALTLRGLFAFYDPPMDLFATHCGIDHVTRNLIPIEILCHLSLYNHRLE